MVGPSAARGERQRPPAALRPRRGDLGPGDAVRDGLGTRGRGGLKGKPKVKNLPYICFFLSFFPSFFLSFFLSFFWGGVFFWGEGIYVVFFAAVQPQEKTHFMGSRTLSTFGGLDTFELTTSSLVSVFGPSPVRK